MPNPEPPVESAAVATGIFLVVFAVAVVVEGVAGCATAEVVADAAAAAVAVVAVAAVAGKLPRWRKSMEVVQ